MSSALADELQDEEALFPEPVAPIENPLLVENSTQEDLEIPGTLDSHDIDHNDTVTAINISTTDHQNISTANLSTVDLSPDALSPEELTNASLPTNASANTSLNTSLPTDAFFPETALLDDNSTEVPAPPPATHLPEFPGLSTSVHELLNSSATMSSEQVDSGNLTEAVPFENVSVPLNISMSLNGTEPATSEVNDTALPENSPSNLSSAETLANTTLEEVPVHDFNASSPAAEFELYNESSQEQLPSLNLTIIDIPHPVLLLNITSNTSSDLFPEELSPKPPLAPPLATPPLTSVELAPETPLELSPAVPSPEPPIPSDSASPSESPSISPPESPLASVSPAKSPAASVSPSPLVILITEKGMQYVKVTDGMACSWSFKLEQRGAANLDQCIDRCKPPVCTYATWFPSVPTCRLFSECPAEGLFHTTTQPAHTYHVLGPKAKDKDEEGPEPTPDEKLPHEPDEEGTQPEPKEDTNPTPGEGEPKPKPIIEHPDVPPIPDRPPEVEPSDDDHSLFWFTTALFGALLVLVLVCMFLQHRGAHQRAAYQQLDVEMGLLGSRTRNE